MAVRFLLTVCPSPLWFLSSPIAFRWYLLNDSTPFWSLIRDLLPLATLLQHCFDKKQNWLPQYICEFCCNAKHTIQYDLKTIKTLLLLIKKQQMATKKNPKSLCSRDEARCVSGGLQNDGESFFFFIPSVLSHPILSTLFWNVSQPNQTPFMKHNS